MRDGANDMSELKSLPSWAYMFFMMNCLVFLFLSMLAWSEGLWIPLLIDVLIVAIVGGVLTAKGYDMGGN